MKENFSAFESLHYALNDPEAYLPLNSVDGASITIHLGSVNLSCEAMTLNKDVSIIYLFFRQIVCRMFTHKHKSLRDTPVSHSN